jgi:hypothetical protein
MSDLFSLQAFTQALNKFAEQQKEIVEQPKMEEIEKYLDGSRFNGTFHVGCELKNDLHGGNSQIFPSLIPVFKESVRKGDCGTHTDAQMVTITKCIFTTEVKIPGYTVNATKILKSTRCINEIITGFIPNSFIRGKGFNGVIGSNKEVVKPTKWILRGKTPTRCVDTGNPIIETDSIVITIVSMEIILNKETNIVLGDIKMLLPPSELKGVLSWNTQLFD